MFLLIIDKQHILRYAGLILNTRYTFYVHTELFVVDEYRIYLVICSERVYKSVYASQTRQDRGGKVSKCLEMHVSNSKWELKVSCMA